jgi:hypothetical protein
MPRTEHRISYLCRAGAAGALALGLLTACGSGESDDPPAAGGPAQSSTAPADGGDFCSRAAGIDERVDSALSDLGNEDASLTDAFRQIAVELRGIEAPAAITADWTSLADGLDRIADALSDFDVTDFDSLERLEQAEGDLTTASANVDDYLSDECGIDS